MVLSERERRLLQEMETHLLAEDPRLASSLSDRPRIGVRAVLALSGLPIGVLLMGVGIWRAHTAGTALALVGYSVLLGSTSVCGEWLRARGNRSPTALSAAGRA